MEKITLVLEKQEPIAIQVPEIPILEQVVLKEGTKGDKGEKGDKGDKGESRIFTADTYLQFPTIGDKETIYVSTVDNRSYRFDVDELKYYCIGSNYDEINIINGSGMNE